MQKPSIPKGMRDFGSVEMARRNYIFNTIRSVYALYGYQQIETPTMENLSTLMGKYGEEGDKLLFKVLNSGDYLKGIDDAELVQRNTLKLANKLSEKGLRYDLTVPFARYVVMHKEELSFPFRRYQIQPVWRADRPQKGRYREFYQCDADIIGSTSLINEVELIQIINEVFLQLGIRTRILLNNRKVLAGIAESIGAEEQLIDITTAIDKLDKIGLDKVRLELQSKGFTDSQLERLEPILLLQGNNEEKLNWLADYFSQSTSANEIGLLGVEELRYIIKNTATLELNTEVCIDLSLARGLSYYTGAILEVKALDAQIGSISGGGRYDNLTGIFGLDGMSGVGISFGADRIYDVLAELDLFPKELNSATDLMFVNFGEDEASKLIPLVARLRKAGIRTELYPDAVKIKKQMTYANNCGIAFVALIGEDEIKNNTITVKNMTTGEQQTLTEIELVEQLKRASLA